MLESFLTASQLDNFNDVVCNFLKKSLLKSESKQVGVFLWNFFEFFKNTYFEIQLWATASESSLKAAQLTLVNYFLNTSKVFIHICHIYVAIQ